MQSLLGLDLLTVASLIAVLHAPNLRHRISLQLIVGRIAILGAAIMLTIFIPANFDIDPIGSVPVEIKLPLNIVIGSLTLGLFIWLYFAVRHQEQ